MLDDAVLDQAHAQLLRVLGDQLRLLSERSAVRVCRERHQVLAQHLKKKRGTRTLMKHTKGIQKVHSFWGKMTSQTKKFVFMIKLTIIEVITKNIMFNLFLVSFLEFFKHQYPT